MKRAIEYIGVIAWWATLPALMVYLWNKPRTRVLVRASGKIMVVRGWLGTGKWMLSGGGLHKHESPLEGALREVREETGLMLKPQHLRLLKEEQYSFRGIKFPCHYFVADLPGEPKDHQLHPQPLEISRAIWIDPAKMSRKNANPDVINALRHAETSRA